MSIKIMSNVWQSADADGGTLLVLLALADFANDDGECWPSVRTLSKKARLSERQTQYAITDLIDAGVVERDLNAGPHHSNLYRVIGGAISAGVQPAGAQGVQPTAPKPPVLEPSIEPPTKPPIKSSTKTSEENLSNLELRLRKNYVEAQKRVGSR